MDDSSTAQDFSKSYISQKQHLRVVRTFLIWSSCCGRNGGQWEIGTRLEHTIEKCNYLVNILYYSLIYDSLSRFDTRCNVTLIMAKVTLNGGSILKGARERGSLTLGASDSFNSTQPLKGNISGLMGFSGLRALGQVIVFYLLLSFRGVHINLFLIFTESQPINEVDDYLSCGVSSYSLVNENGAGWYLLLF